MDYCSLPGTGYEQQIVPVSARNYIAVVVGKEADFVCHRYHSRNLAVVWKAIVRSTRCQLVNSGYYMK